MESMLCCGDNRIREEQVAGKETTKTTEKTDVNDTSIGSDETSKSIYAFMNNTHVGQPFGYDKVRESSLLGEVAECDKQRNAREVWGEGNAKIKVSRLANLDKEEGSIIGWHYHEGTDELLWVQKGCISADYKDREPIIAREGEMILAPGGVEHNPLVVATPELSDEVLASQFSNFTPPEDMGATWTGPEVHVLATGTPAFAKDHKGIEAHDRTKKVSLYDEFEKMGDAWKSKPIFSLNTGLEFSVMKMKGEKPGGFLSNDCATFIHVHKGQFTMQLEENDGGNKVVKEKSFIIIPKDMKHCPTAEEECQVVFVQHGQWANIDKNLERMEGT